MELRILIILMVAILAGGGVKGGPHSVSKQKNHMKIAFFLKKNYALFLKRQREIDGSTERSDSFEELERLIQQQIDEQQQQEQQQQQQPQAEPPQQQQQQQQRQPEVEADLVLPASSAVVQQQGVS